MKWNLGGTKRWSEEGELVRFVCEYIYIHLAVRLTTRPKPLPKPAPHILRSRASFFKWQYPLLSSRSSSSFLRLLPRLPITSIPPFIYPSITRCRRQFLRKMWPIQIVGTVPVWHCTTLGTAPIWHYTRLAGYHVWHCTSSQCTTFVNEPVCTAPRSALRQLALHQFRTAPVSCAGNWPSFLPKVYKRH